MRNPIPELAIVRLLHPIEDWLVGAIGTVFHRHDGELKYDVQFTCPCCPPEVLTVDACDIEEVSN